MDQPLYYVDIIRRGYGRRYTWLPVDRLDRDGFAANYNGSHITPTQIDVRIDDIARWREGESYFEGRVTLVQHDDSWLTVSFDNVQHISFEIYYS